MSKTIWVVHMDEHHGDTDAYTATTEEKAKEIGRQLALECLGDEAEDYEDADYDEVIAAINEFGDYINIYETTLDETPEDVDKRDSEEDGEQG